MSYYSIPEIKHLSDEVQIPKEPIDLPQIIAERQAVKI